MLLTQNVKKDVKYAFISRNYLIKSFIFVGVCIKKRIYTGRNQ